MSTDIYLACKPCRKCIWIGQDGMSGFIFYRGEHKCMVALSGFMLDHIHCPGNMEVMSEYECEDYGAREW
jgi:hypothetical protein